MIRKVEMKDLLMISKIYEKEMSKEFEKVDEEPLLADNYHKILKAKAKKSKMFVLDDGGIKGFMWYEKEGDEFNLEDIFTSEKGKGYGKSLMNFMIKDAKKTNIKKINLDVHLKNFRAIKFFKGFGFKERTVEMSLCL